MPGGTDQIVAGILAVRGIIEQEEVARFGEQLVNTIGCKVTLQVENVGIAVGICDLDGENVPGEPGVAASCKTGRAINGHVHRAEDVFVRAKAFQAKLDLVRDLVVITPSRDMDRVIRYRNHRNRCRHQSLSRDGIPPVC
ncbi:MAG: hypothetical protein HRU31_17235 [Rhodobacteraceae bacterium]|nr:hypothetical protein [Paracoccaceae bacterium]